MSIKEKMVKAKDVTKTDIKEASKRTVVAQTLKVIREPLVELISNSMGNTKRDRTKAAKFLEELFKSDIGEAMLYTAIGAGLSQVPIPGIKKDTVDMIAGECRVQGYTKGGMMLADLLTGPAVESIKKLAATTEAIGATSKVSDVAGFFEEENPVQVMESNSVSKARV